MNYYTVQPSHKLSGLVRFFWVLENEIPQGESYIHRTMADGCPEMFFHYKGVFSELVSDDKSETSIAAGIGGQSQKFNRFCINKSFGMFGAYLYPFAIPRLFNIPASALTNQMPDLISLLGQEGKDLEEKMMTANDNLHRVQILTSFLEEKLAKDYYHEHHLFSAINYIIKTRGTVSVEDLSGQHYLSTRQFERKFKQFAGFSPKLYSRIIRFQSAMSEYGKKEKSLTEIAYDCGYYDQSHFIHDFKEFSGHHPKKYFSGNAEGTEWRES